MALLLIVYLCIYCAAAADGRVQPAAQPLYDMRADDRQPLGPAPPAQGGATRLEARHALHHRHRKGHGTATARNLYRLAQCATLTMWYLHQPPTELLAPLQAASAPP